MEGSKLARHELWLHLVSCCSGRSMFSLLSGFRHSLNFFNAGVTASLQVWRFVRPHIAHMVFVGGGGGGRIYLSVHGQWQFAGRWTPLYSGSCAAVVSLGLIDPCKVLTLRSNWDLLA